MEMLKRADASDEATAGAVGRPLATFALFSYNQQEFVFAAVEAALKQDYRPLQIVLSDDASTDQTFERMSEAAKSCPEDVQLVLNRNETNLGIAEHINKVVGISEGKYLVLASGDDISLPHRTSVSVDSLENDPKGRTALHGAVMNITSEGEFVRVRRNPYRHLTDDPQAVVDYDVYLTGSSTAVHRSIYTEFPPLLAGVVNEDKVTAFRCALQGGAIYLEEPLLMYREGVGVSVLNGEIYGRRSDPSREAKYVRTLSLRRLGVLEQLRLDSVSPALSGRASAQLVSLIERRIHSQKRIVRFVEAPRWIGLPSLIRGGGLNRKTWRIAVLFLLPGLFRWYRSRTYKEPR